jgi:hypothetical protein
MDVTDPDLTALDVCVFDLATRAKGIPPAERSLEITELYQGDGRIILAVKVAYLGKHGIH